MRCVLCLEPISKSVLRSRPICQACYQYERKGGRINEPSPKGVITFDQDNNPICHICGQAHKKLGGHIYWHHHMTVAEYKERYKLNAIDQLTCPSYRSVMREHVLNHPEVIENNLRVAGTPTRYNPRDPRCTGRRNRKYKTPVVSFAPADTNR
ncbi:MAG: hypothetical protein EOL95_09070 [Bacteroidia bacterium]|nr:hypothetical protein [Bacteroidia bacterium]